MLYELVRRARKLGASDLHLAGGTRPAVRVGGALQLLGEQCLPEGALQNVLQQLLSAEAWQKLLQAGEVDTAFSEAPGERCRLNAYRQGGVLAASIRLLQSIVPGCDTLGLPLAVQKLADLQQGLVLVTGATGSGKSTTLAALVQRINETRAVHVLTLEDPIEYVYTPRLALISQREVGRDTQSFASGLRSALRQDPDVILVGELRDAETMAIALTAAETGHLVLATLHTQEAAGAVGRILDVLPDKRQVSVQLAECLQAVVCQRLLPRADGSGRAAAFEVLIATPALRNLIREGRTHQLESYIQTGGRFGMQTMAAAIEELRKRGIVR